MSKIQFLSFKHYILNRNFDRIKKKVLTGIKFVETPERVCFKEFMDNVFERLDAGPRITHRNY